jgi:hypothetical protein
MGWKKGVEKKCRGVEKGGEKNVKGWRRKETGAFDEGAYLLEGRLNGSQTGVTLAAGLSPSPRPSPSREKEPGAPPPGRGRG